MHRAGVYYPRVRTFSVRVGGNREGTESLLSPGDGMRIGISFCIAITWSLFALPTTLRHAAAAERTQRVPLGGVLDGQLGEKAFAVYVPTRLGGVLTVKSSNGMVEGLAGPDGQSHTNGQ